MARQMANQLGWVVFTPAGTLTGMKSLVGAFLAITAINSAPGLSASTATYLTVLAAGVAVIFSVAARRRRRRNAASMPPVAAPLPPAPPAGPTIIQHIYTTQPVFTGGYQHPGPSTTPPSYVHSERVGQVILPDSIYQPSKK